MTKSARSKVKTVSARELAKLLGLATKTIANLATDGVVVRVARGRFDGMASVQRYVTHLRKLAAKHKPTPLAENQATLTRVKADGLERANREEASQLIRAADADAEWADVSKLVRDGCLSVMPRIGAALPHLDEAGLEVIRSEILDVLKALDGPPPHRRRKPA